MVISDDDRGNHSSNSNNIFTRTRSNRIQTNKSNEKDSIQIKVIDKEEGISEVKLKGDNRCSRCIKLKRSDCIILIGTKNHSVALCNHCRKKETMIYRCKPKIELLENYFPNQSQIIYSKQRIQEWESRFQSNSTSNSVVNETIETSSRTSDNRTNHQRYVNANLASTNSSNSLVQSSTSFLAPNAQPSFISQSTSTQVISSNKDKGKLKESLSNRIEDIKDLLELQTNIIMRGIKRDLENQKAN